MAEQRLNFFTVRDDGKVYIRNRKMEHLGFIERHRIGRFMHWCFFPAPVSIFSPGCMDEIREQMRELGGRKRLPAKTMQSARAFIRRILRCGHWGSQDCSKCRHGLLRVLERLEA